jgi:O-antigen/teichoic acid export membrane protein
MKWKALLDWVLLTLSGLLTLLSTYLIRFLLKGGLEQVGYYNAGFTLNSYVGVIFTVMSTDYFQD